MPVLRHVECGRLRSYQPTMPSLRSGNPSRGARLSEDQACVSPPDASLSCKSGCWKGSGDTERHGVDAAGVFAAGDKSVLGGGGMAAVATVGAKADVGCSAGEQLGGDGEEGMGHGHRTALGSGAG